LNSRFLRTIVVLVPGLTGAYLYVLYARLHYCYADAQAQLGSLAVASIELMLVSLGGFGVSLAVFIMIRRSKDRGKSWKIANAIVPVSLCVLLLLVAIGLMGLCWEVEARKWDVPAETSENTSTASVRWSRQDADVIGGDVGLLVDDDGDASTPGTARFAVYDAFGCRAGRADSYSPPCQGGAGGGSSVTRDPPRSPLSTGGKKTARTAGFGDDDVSNNRDHYYLADAMGGNVGLLVDDDGDARTPGTAQFVVYDAFGNEMAAGAANADVMTKRKQMVHQDAPYKRARIHMRVTEVSELGSNETEFRRSA